MNRLRVTKRLLATLAVLLLVLSLPLLVGACGASADDQTTTTAASAQPSTTAAAGMGLTKADITAFVNKAKAYVDANGKVAALKEFMNTSGDFYPNGGELYIFAYDLGTQGINLCLPPSPAKVGTSLWDLKDDTGNYFIRAFDDIAKTKGSGWITYRYPNPAENNAVQDKTSYILKIDDTWFLGAGAYGVTS